MKNLGKYVFVRQHDWQHMCIICCVCSVCVGDTELQGLEEKTAVAEIISDMVLSEELMSDEKQITDDEVTVSSALYVPCNDDVEVVSELTAVEETGKQGNCNIHLSI